MNKIIIAVWVLLVIGCNNAPASGKAAIADKIIVDTMNDPSLVYREKASGGAAPKSPGELIGRIACKVKTKDLKEYEDGIIPFISLDSTQKEIKQLIDKDNIVVPDKKVTIIIDYPLSSEHKFDVTSAGGFTRQQLVEAISKEYHRIYEEEEATAKIKTLPLAKRKMYNRNQTDGKYGIWGHDLGDLVLDEILIYKTEGGEIVLTLEIES